MDYDFSNLTLLYVEDDIIIKEQAVLYLKKLFLKVFDASNGIEGLSCIENFHQISSSPISKCPRWMV